MTTTTTNSHGDSRAGAQTPTRCPSCGAVIPQHTRSCPRKPESREHRMPERAIPYDGHKETR